MLRPFLILILLATLGDATCLPASQPARPNIVYILADDLGYGDVQILNPGRGRIATPHLDRLAAQGMIFTDAHSGSSVCTPTRYGILTGRYAWRTRLQSGVLEGTNDPPLIAADRLTVPAFLKKHGYATAAIGKWHLGFRPERPDELNSSPKEDSVVVLPVGTRILEGPVARGFEYFWGCSNARTMHALIENDRVVERIEPIDMLLRLGRRAVSYIGDRAAAAKAGKPFFLYLALTSPHTPILPSADWKGRSGLGDYADFVMQTDGVVGDVLAALDRAGIADNTLVVFTSDNGCSPAAEIDRLERQGHFPGGPFRGSKSDIWEGGHRVPLLVRWPGRTRPGSRCGELVCLTDLLATCAELLGERLPATAAEDSSSFLSALIGEGRAPLREAVVHHSIHGRFAIRQGRWKLALCPGSGGWSKPTDSAAKETLPAVQLYDLRADIGETHNLQADHPQIVARLTRLLEQQIADGRSTPGAKQRNDAPIQFVNAD